MTLLLSRLRTLVARTRMQDFTFGRLEKPLPYTSFLIDNERMAFSPWYIKRVFREQQEYLDRPVESVYHGQLNKIVKTSAFIQAWSIQSSLLRLGLTFAVVYPLHYAYGVNPLLILSLGSLSSIWAYERGRIAGKLMDKASDVAVRALESIRAPTQHSGSDDKDV